MLQLDRRRFDTAIGLDLNDEMIRIQSYLDVTSKMLLEQLKKRVTEKQSFGFMFILAAICNGLIIIAYGELFSIVENFSRKALSENLVYMLAAAPAVFLIAWYLNTIRFPFSSGSGIPQIMTATEVSTESPAGKSFVRQALSFRTAVAKICGSLMVVLAGGAVGREGPSLHISASIFFLFHRALNKIHRTPDHKSWIIGGAAAGLAAAFNTPLGGIVYAIEELGSQYFTKIKNNLLLAVLVSGIASQTILGTYLFIGTPETNPYNYRLLALITALSAFCGLAGAFFGHLVYLATKLKNRIISIPGRVICVSLIAVIVCLLASLDPFALGTGREYIASLLFTDQTPSALTVPLRLLNTCLVYMTGVAGGIFAPSLALGAGLGFHFSGVIESLMPFSNTNLFILCGMVSFLTGVTRTPLTSFILVVEMTDRHISIVPLMLAALIGSVVAKLWSKEGFYEIAMRDYLQQVKDQTDKVVANRGAKP